MQSEKMEKARTKEMSRRLVGGSGVAECTAEQKTKQVVAAAPAQAKATAAPSSAALSRMAAERTAPRAVAAEDMVIATTSSTEAAAFSSPEKIIPPPAAGPAAVVPAARLTEGQSVATASSSVTAGRNARQKAAQLATSFTSAFFTPKPEAKLAAADVASPASLNTRRTAMTYAAGERKHVRGGLISDEVIRGRHIDPVKVSAPRPVVRFDDAALHHSTSSDKSASPILPDVRGDTLLPSIAAAKGKGDFEEVSAPSEARTAVDENAETTVTSGGAAEERLAPRGEWGGGKEKLARVTAAEVIGEDTLPEQARTVESKKLSDASVQSVALTRQISKGYTGETWYDFDLPLGRTDPITIIHFNDVYNINSRLDGSGGVARFVTAMQQFQHLHPFILFSGDVFNPSVMSTYTRGRHMVPFLNILKVHTACFGNHDFDFGVDELEYAIGSCNFPWLLSNVFQKTAVETELQIQWQLQRRKTRASCGIHEVTTHAIDATKGDEENEEEQERREKLVVEKTEEYPTSPEDRDEEEIATPTRSDSTYAPRLFTLRTMDESRCSELLRCSRNPSPAVEAALSIATPPSSSPRRVTDEDTAIVQNDGASLHHAVDATATDKREVCFPEEHKPLSREEEEEDQEADGGVSVNEAEQEMQRSSGRFVEDYIETYGLPLANGMKYRLCEWQGIKVGLIGLVEREWLDTLGSIDQEDVTYVDFVKAANCLSRVLRQKECELVIALTHMRAPNDEKLAREAEDIDLILGGHDHDYYGLQRIGNIPVVKSGTDFRDFTVLTIYPGSLARKKEQEKNIHVDSITEQTAGKKDRTRDNGTRVISGSGTPSPSLSVSLPASSVPPSSSSSTASAALAAAAPTSSDSATDSAAGGVNGRPVEEDEGEHRGGAPAGAQRESRLLPPLPTRSNRSSKSSSRSSSSRSSSRMEATRSARSTPSHSPRSHSGSQVRARAPGLAEAKPRMTQKPSSKQFHGPLLPTEVREGEEEMPFFLGGSLVQWKRVEVKPELYAKNIHVERLVKKYEEHLEGQMQKVLVDVGCDLETRFSLLRTQETNVGSWICDVVRRECKAEIALLNSGTIRSDCVFPEGQLKYGDLAQMLPMADDMCVIKVSGRILLQALENSVSLIPRTEGRFLQVAGIRFAFDSRKPPGERVLHSSIRIATTAPGASSRAFPFTSYNSSLLKKTSMSYSSLALWEKRGTTTATTHDEENEEEEHEDPSYAKLDMEKTYTVATKTYVAQGRDGYHMFTPCPVLVEAELLPPLPTMVRSALSMAELANGIKRPHSRIMFKRLTSFTSMEQDDLLKDYGCRVTAASQYVLAPQADGRIRNVAYDGAAR